MPDTTAAHEAAIRLGHVLVWDPPAAFTATKRWTCRECRRAVLVCGPTVYGSATTERCAR